MKEAEQVWLEIDVPDYVSEECKWAEVRQHMQITI